MTVSSSVCCAVLVVYIAGQGKCSGLSCNWPALIYPACYSIGPPGTFILILFPTLLRLADRQMTILPDPPSGHHPTIAHMAHLPQIETLFAGPSYHCSHCEARTHPPHLSTETQSVCLSLCLSLHSFPIKCFGPTNAFFHMIIQASINFHGLLIASNMIHWTQLNASTRNDSKD